MLEKNQTQQMASEEEKTLSSKEKKELRIMF